ncbi:MAG: response regulator transcription factor [Candidatus Limnocylindrales bacterium]|nr:response regulator transcription factor [Candidatus Limnocylindrales bacterium]
MIRVVVVDDHALIRSGLSGLLEGAGMAVVGTAADGLAGVDVALAERPDVVLIDLSMPRLDGVGATRRLLKAWPEARVVVLTSFSDRDRVLAAFDAGATGFLLKDSDPEDLVRGIEAAARGEAPVAPRAARALLDDRQGRAPAADLTVRQREVLAQLAVGRTNKEIGSRLGITEKTVKAHLTSIFSRLGVMDRTEAALWAMRHGFLDPTG